MTDRETIHRAVWRGLLVGTVTCSLLCGTAVAQVPQGNSRWYYKIGGGTPVLVAPPPWQLSEQFGFRGSIGYELGDMCSNFSPGAAWSAELRAAKDRFEALLTNGFEVALIGFAMNELANRAPQLYDAVKDMMWRMDEMWNVSMKSCRDMMRDIDEGRDPFEDFIKVGREGSMRNAGSDAAIQNAMQNANGLGGIPWLGSSGTATRSAGGQGQPPVKVVGDTVLAGYNLLLKRPPTSTAAPLGGADALVDEFPTPQAAIEWTRLVVGDAELTTFDAGGQTTVPGHGLAPLLDDETRVLTTAVADLVSRAGPVTPTELASISAPRRAMTGQVIYSLRGLSIDERGYAVSRLAEEIAMARIIERALFARRMLLTGMREPNISQSPAPPHIQIAVDELRDELETLAFEYRMRRDVVSNTAAQIIDRAARGVGGRAQQGDRSNSFTTGGGVSP